MTAGNVSNQKTIQQIIDSTSNATAKRNTGELGKDDFLNLLVTQLRYQDPLNPTDDKEFISQMAQFSSLEQMQNMNSSISQSHAFSLIGKHVYANVTDDTTKEVTQVDGDVSSVKIADGKVFVIVKGKEVPVDSITDVEESLGSSSSSNLAQYTNLIGFNAKGSVYDSDTGDIIQVNGTVKSIEKGLYEDYAVMDGVKADIGEIITDTPSADPNFMSEYLESNKGKEIQAMIVDSESGQKVPVKAVLDSYEIKNGVVTAVFDKVYVPVESISAIEPVQQMTES